MDVNKMLDEILDGEPDEGLVGKEEAKKIVEALKKHNADGPCPRCRHTKYNVLRGFFANSIVTDPRMISIGGPSIHSVVTICSKCGFISQYDMNVLGLRAEKIKKN